MEILHYKFSELEALGDADQRINDLDSLELERYKKSGLNFLLARSELKRALAKRAGLQAQEIHFIYNEHGKPSCPQLPKLHFNISHSGDMLIIGISDTPIGIDIERQRERKQETFATIAKRFMPEPQLQAFLGRNCPKQEFYDCWSSCEAIIKLQGLSIWQAKEIPNYQYKEGKIIFIEPENQERIALQLLHIDKNYSAAMATQVFSLPAQMI